MAALTQAANRRLKPAALEHGSKSSVSVARGVRICGIGLNGPGSLRTRPVDGCFQQACGQPAAAEPAWNKEAGQGPDRRIVRVRCALDTGGIEPWKRRSRCDGAPPDGGVAIEGQQAHRFTFVVCAGPCWPSALRGRAAEPLRAWPGRAGTSSSAVRRATRRGTRSQARWTAQRVET